MDGRVTMMNIEHLVSWLACKTDIFGNLIECERCWDLILSDLHKSVKTYKAEHHGNQCEYDDTLWITGQICEKLSGAEYERMRTVDGDTMRLDPLQN